MDKELIEKLLKVFNEYEQWRKDTNSLDDLDLVRLATNALEAYENNDAEKSSTKAQIISEITTLCSWMKRKI